MIQRVVARGQIFDVAVIAGEYNGSLIQINANQQFANELGEVLENRPSGRHVLLVADLVRDEVFVQGEPIFGDYRRQYNCRLFRCSQSIHLRHAQ